MLTKRDVDDVLVQGDYQSGDRYTVASALRLNPKLGVLMSENLFRSLWGSKLPLRVNYRRMRQGVSLQRRGILRRKSAAASLVSARTRRSGCHGICARSAGQ